MYNLYNSSRKITVELETGDLAQFNSLQNKLVKKF